jgi:hypothetical protein
MKNGVWTHSSGNAKAYPREDEHFVEPVWVSQRLFEEEEFVGGVYDPACGFGRIVVSALKAGIRAYGSDLVDRGWGVTVQDFLGHRDQHDNVVTNPPFDQIKEFTLHALDCARQKVAVIMPVARLNAAHWLLVTPLRRIWFLTPRPSMPPGHVITNGGKVTGGKTDYAWVVLEHGFRGAPEVKWMHRDGRDAPFCLSDDAAGT